MMNEKLPVAERSLKPAKKERNYPYLFVIASVAKQSGKSLSIWRLLRRSSSQ